MFSKPLAPVLDRTKLKAVADDTLQILKVKASDLEMVEGIVGIGDNAGYLRFLLFP